jgi:hypothetical protein
MASKQPIIVAFVVSGIICIPPCQLSHLPNMKSKKGKRIEAEMMGTRFVIPTLSRYLKINQRRIRALPAM